jgi:histidinol-phosphatase (PHP family)
MMEGAINNGVSVIAVTDHCDIDCLEDGFYPEYKEIEARAAFDKAAERYSGSLTAVFGMEFGQPYLREASVRRMIRERDIRFVISSVHNLENVPDFIFMDYSDMPYPLIHDLFRRYIAELCRAAAFDGAHTLAHIAYPLRYIRRDGKDLDVMRFCEEYRELFRIMTDKGIALELNTSGIRKGGETIPSEPLLKLYRECGGRLVTCGSDAHAPCDIGCDVINGMKMLAAAGFEYITVPGENGPVQERLDV